MKDFSVFISLRNVKGKVHCLVHISAIRQNRVNHMVDLLSRGQLVKVKVVSIQGTRIGFSMKGINQNTGRDLDPAYRIASCANMERLEEDSKSKVKKQRSSPKRWEIKLLIVLGAVSAADYLDIDEEHHATLTREGQFEEEEDVDIEMRQSSDPPPIRVVKAPSGLLNTVAVGGTVLAKERRELR
ncbi:hypothetical protein HOY80DRAFT_1094308 [Tuber brumale]|nr:hypothetical protein HOY80DRAFT_1094308 [Tuber brumale]